MNNEMKKSEILEWSHKYDKEHPWWTETELELGNKLRDKREFNANDLSEMIKWKFKTDPRRMKKNLDNASKNEDYVLRDISRFVYNLSPKYDHEKISSLSRIKGVGAAMATVILTFFDPKNYGVFDKHVWKELYGNNSEPLYNTRDCLLCLTKLRHLAKIHNLDVRVVEKALFKKHFDNCNNRDTSKEKYWV